MGKKGEIAGVKSERQRWREGENPGGREREGRKVYWSQREKASDPEGRRKEERQLGKAGDRKNMFIMFFTGIHRSWLGLEQTSPQ